MSARASYCWVKWGIQAPWGEEKSHYLGVVGDVPTLHTASTVPTPVVNRGDWLFTSRQSGSVDPALASTGVMGTGKSTLSPVLGRLLSGFLLTSPDTTQGGEEENLPVGQDGISGLPLGFVHGGGRATFSCCCV